MRPRAHVRHILTYIGAPSIETKIEKDPHNIHEMPIPGGSLKAPVMPWGEMVGGGAEKANKEEEGADEHMEAVETGGDKEGGPINAVRNAKGGGEILLTLN